MKIKSVEIKNFRSIENITISLNPRCRILVGINEAGKSNIMRVLRLFGNEFVPKVMI